MRREFEFEFTPSFVRSGLRRDSVRRTLRGVIAYLLVVAGLLYAMHGTDAFDAPVLGWIAAGAAFILVARTIQLSRSVARIHALWSKQSPRRRMRFVLDDEALELQMESGSNRYRWRDFQRLRCYPKVWLLEVVRNTCVLFPVQDASSEVREMLLERCQHHGVRASPRPPPT